MVMFPMTHHTRILPLALALLAASACVENLQHDLPEQDANDIMVLLNENGIHARKEREEGGNEPRYVISVPRADYAQSAKLLREYSLPRPAQGGFSDFRKGKGMIPTQTEERAMFLEAVGGEISNALNKVDGVLESRVIVMIPEATDLTQPENRPRPSASVFVKYRQEGDKPPLDEAQVKAFVSTAVEQMDPRNVTVIMTAAARTTVDGSGKGRLQDVLGLRMTAESATTFKILLGTLSLIILALAGYTTWSLLGGGESAPVPAPRTRTRPPEA
jgi:type III secretion protein J